MSAPRFATEAPAAVVGALVLMGVWDAWGHLIGLALWTLRRRAGGCWRGLVRLVRMVHARLAAYCFAAELAAEDEIAAVLQEWEHLR